MYELITQDTLQEYEAFVQSHPKGSGQIKQPAVAEYGAAAEDHGCLAGENISFPASEAGIQSGMMVAGQH